MRIIFVVVVCGLLVACGLSSPALPDMAPSPQTAGIANPASVNCIRHGGQLKLVDGTAGQFGMCVLPSGRQCEEWSLMRGECAADF